MNEVKRPAGAIRVLDSGFVGLVDHMGSDSAVVQAARVSYGAGTKTLREWLTVLKTRELWIIDNMRIHIDDVDQLGNFIEFEALVSKNRDVKECHLAVNHLRELFGPIIGEPVAPSYCDLMSQIVSADSG